MPQLPEAVSMQLIGYVEAAAKTKLLDGALLPKMHSSLLALHLFCMRHASPVATNLRQALSSSF
eukprot:scaffold112411_cov40-Prasinocladus_malaysianus.AAC.1